MVIHVTNNTIKIPCNTTLIIAFTQTNYSVSFWSVYILLLHNWLFVYHSKHLM